MAIEAGMPDLTLGGVAGPAGAVSAENLRAGQGIAGVVFQYAGVDAGEDWVYTVQLADEAGKRVLVVRCPETLWYSVYPLGDAAEVGRQLLGDIMANNEKFSAWRADGGELGYKERHSVPSVKGLAASRGLVDFLERKYRAGTTLDAGPAENWWGGGDVNRAEGLKIAEGRGIAPAYRLAPVEEPEDAMKPENRPYVNSIYNAGVWMIAGGAIAALQGVAVLSAGIYPLLHWKGWTPVIQWSWGRLGFAGGAILFFVLETAYATAMVVTGSSFRELKGRRMAAKTAWLMFTPVFGPLLLGGLPLGIWALRLIRDPRATKIFRD